MPCVVLVLSVRTRERARPSPTTRLATSATVSEASARAAFAYFGFPRSSKNLLSVIEVDIHRSGYEYTLAWARACSEASAFVAFDPAAVIHSARYGSLHNAVGFAADFGRAQTTKSTHVYPSVGSNRNANISRWNSARLVHCRWWDKEMLKGYTAPRSPWGTAALVPSSPWHFAGDVLAVEFWNDPDVSLHILPAGVELDKKCPGHSVALFTDYQFTAENDEYLDPARYQCRGFSILLDAIWKRTRIAWRPYCYVDNDAALMRGWIQGFPRKIDTVHQTRTFATTSVASATLVQDGRFSACMSAHGRLLVQAGVTLREKAERFVGVFDRQIVGRRYFPRLSAGMHDKPAVDELVRCVADHPPDHKYLGRRGGTQFSRGLWRRAGSAGAAQGGARISVLAFLFRHRYRDPGRPYRLANAGRCQQACLDSEQE
jgi:hypothetical protein